ncbi:MAG: carbohydrate ABC transporter substrate-binding protein [Opitutaceae bacterium]|nr:carbohydrate ABC transporter substrate-binding protein [Opitutaceae bacterium]
MKRRRYFRLSLGLLGGACVLFCLWRVLQPFTHRAAADRITIRFGHWQLEPGIRQAFDALIADYEALHPGITVEQVPVPGKIYRQWGRTQLAGGTAPDLVQLGLGVVGGSFYDYFQPITAEVNQPNPYNAGTPLQGIPWRNTFNDGMETGYDPETFECYGASLFTGTTRIYCNTNLLRKITGRDQPPATFSEFQTLARQVQAYAQRTGEDIEPIAGSSLTGILMLDDLFCAQLQVISSRLNPAMDLPLGIEDFYLEYLLGHWTLADPALQAGAELMHEAGALLSPGFTQIEHDQAHIRFVQGRAVMLMGFSVQATGIFDQVSFPVRIIRNPQPLPTHPRFGPQMRGHSAENGLRAYGGFGLSRSSPHPAEALDFLRFITSAAACEKFCRISRCLPSVVGVEPPASMRDFMPDLQGYPPGPSFYVSPDTRAVILNSQYLLVGPEGSPAAWLAHLRTTLGPALRSDLERTITTRLGSVRRIETSIAAAQHLLAPEPANQRLAQKFQSQLEAQNEMEATAHYTRLRLRQAAAMPISAGRE